MEPMTGGRAMNAHFATRSLTPDGNWKDLTAKFNTSADVSPTGSQMPRLVGLAYASKLYRELEVLAPFTTFSDNGNEVAFGTVGNATCAEGMFWEAVNAVGVLQAPMVLSIWDDEYGISVPNEYQITKQNISALLQGFQREPDSKEGYDIYTVPGWDYPALIDVYQKAATSSRSPSRRDTRPRVATNATSRKNGWRGKRSMTGSDACASGWCSKAWPPKKNWTRWSGRHVEKLKRFVALPGGPILRPFGRSYRN
jgi:hypothetical protein